MIKAVPTNEKGEQVGAAQTFTHEQFDTMKRCFRTPKHFRWKIIEGSDKPQAKELISTKEAKPKVTVKPIEINDELMNKK
jgi:hypothetical protein